MGVPIENLPETAQTITALYDIEGSLDWVPIIPRDPSVGFSIWTFKVLHRGCERNVEAVTIRYQRGLEPASYRKFHVPILYTLQEISRQIASQSGRFIVLKNSASS